MSKYYLGIDLGGTNIVAGVADSGYTLLEKVSMPTKASRPFADVVRSMADAAMQAVKKAGLQKSDFDCVGIGVPSAVHPQTSNVVYANNLGWTDVDLAGEFKKYWDIPVYLSNDADCAALGESIAGAGKNYTNSLLVTLGTGLGVGLVRDGKLFLGGDGYGVEPGHGTLVHGGLPCSCGRRGCFEAYGSVTALIRRTIDWMLATPTSAMWEECGRDLNRVSGRTSFNAAKKGDKAAKNVVDEYITYVGSGFSSLATTFRPDVIIVGGGISNEGETLLGPVRDIVNASPYAQPPFPPPAVVKAQLGNDAGILGAAVLHESL